jgi:hypothetical protein
MPKLREVIGRTETNIYCQTAVCLTCVLAVRRTIRLGLTEAGNQKALKHSEKKLYTYKFRAYVQLFRRTNSERYECA